MTETRDGALEAALGRERPTRAYVSVDSTNRAARDWALEGAPDGALVLARQQEAGRGRQGRSWLTVPGESLAMSLILRPGEIPGGVQTVTLLAAVAVARALEREGGAAIQIKWPNDLWLSGRKVCGILTQLAPDGAGGWCVIVGIGVNLAQRTFPEALRETATSLFRETGRCPEAPALALAIAREADALRADWQREGFAPLARLYRPRMALVGEWVTLTEGERVHTLRLTGVSDDGALQGLDEAGRPFSTISGEVTVRRTEHD